MLQTRNSFGFNPELLRLIHSRYLCKFILFTDVAIKTKLTRTFDITRRSARFYVFEFSWRIGEFIETKKNDGFMEGEMRRR